MSRPKPPPADDPLPIAAAIRLKLASGRSMSALKAAKDFAKRHGTPLAADVLAEAYAARIAELGEGGLHKEASELIAVARARFPSRSASWDDASTTAARARGDLSDVLTRWRDAPDQREAITLELRATVRDPSWVADNTVLAADDPLRVAAQAVRTAFFAAADGKLDDAGRATLRAVGRRSPLVPWRAFVLALDAFHRQDDARCREQLAAIEDADAVARGRDVLRAALLDTDLSAAPPMRRAVAQLVGELPALVGAVRVVARPQSNHTQWSAAARSLVRRLAAVSRPLALRFLHWIASTSHPDDALMCADDAGGAERLFGGDEATRFVALLATGPAEIVSCWTIWLVSKPPHLRRIDDLELAVVLGRLAAMMPLFGREVAAVLDQDSYRAWCSGSPIDHVAERLLDSGSKQRVAVGAGMFGLQMLLATLESRTKVACRGNDFREQLLRHTVALDPVRENFAKLLDSIAPGDRTSRDAALLGWAAALPTDVEPLILLATDAEGRHALRTAIGYVERAEAIDGIDKRVRAARVRVTLARLVKHWRDGKPELCRRDLASLEALPAASSKEHRMFLRGVRALLDGAPPESFEADFGGADAARSIAALVRHVLDGAPAVLFGESVRRRLAMAALVARIANAIGREFEGEVSSLGPLGGVVREDLPTDFEDLLALCQFSESVLWQRTRNLAACAGLATDNPRLALFLLYRVISVNKLVIPPIEDPEESYEWSERTLRLAVFYAARLADREAQSILSRRVQGRLEPMSAEEAAAALAAEREVARAALDEPPPSSGSSASRQRSKSSKSNKPNKSSRSNKASKPRASGKSRDRGPFLPFDRELGAEQQP